MMRFWQRKLKVKKYAFCSDSDVWYDITCASHDRGVLAQEIVSNIIEGYYVNYELRNFPGDRNQYTGRGYLGSIF